MVLPVLAWSMEEGTVVISVNRREDITSLSRVLEVGEVSRANMTGEDSDLVLEVVQLEPIPVPDMAGTGARVLAGARSLMAMASKARFKLTAPLTDVVSDNLSSRTWRPTCLGIPA